MGGGEVSIQPQPLDFDLNFDLKQLDLPGL